MAVIFSFFRIIMPALRGPSFYGGANRSIPHAGPPKVASRGRALTKSTTSILSLNVRSSPAAAAANLGDT
jgi:hypothetical protein